VPNLKGDAIVTFRFTGNGQAALSTPIETCRVPLANPSRRFGFVGGGRTGGGAREWFITNGTKDEIGATDITVKPLQ
jgi:hypothetical protein